MKKMTFYHVIMKTMTFLLVSLTVPCTEGFLSINSKFFWNFEKNMLNFIKAQQHLIETNE